MGAARLTPDPAPRALVIGEGIKVSAPAGPLRLPAWAALFADNLGDGLALPDAVRAATIAADADQQTAQRSPAACERRWRA